VSHTVNAAVLVTVSSTTAGDALVIEVGANHSNYATPAVTSITDNGAAHASYALAVRQAIPSPDSQDAEIWFAANIPAGITHVTVNISSQGAATVWVGEFSGIALTNPVDQTASQIKMGGTSHGTGTTGTTTQVNELVVAVYAYAGYNTTISPPGTWTQDLNAAPHTWDQMAAIHKLGASLATYQATFTTSGSTNSAAAIATFKIR
jgi:hypothetical protein